MTPPAPGLTLAATVGKVTLSRGRFALVRTVGAGATKRLRVKLSKAARRKLRRAKKLRVVVALTTETLAPVRRTVTLKR